MTTRTDKSTFVITKSLRLARFLASNSRLSILGEKPDWMFVVVAEKGQREKYFPTMAWPIGLIEDAGE